MSAQPGISNKVQAYIMIAASASLSVGAYLSMQTSDPRWIILGGVLAAVGVGVKEALGTKGQPAQ